MLSRTTVVLFAILVAVSFVTMASFYGRYSADQAAVDATAETSDLVRPHSPILGRADAAVTIVEFFDPACEGCRAFHPVVKDILAAYPGDVRVVLRYVPFHTGSDEAVRILDAARRQGVFAAVLDALLAEQPAWAAHGAPDLENAWQVAGAAGLNVERARADAFSIEADHVIEHDVADARAIRIQQTPTFFVNRQPLEEFGPEALRQLVRSEVEKLSRR